MFALLGNYQVHMYKRYPNAEIDRKIDTYFATDALD